MQINLYVRFLGNLAAVTLPGYPVAMFGSALNIKLRKYQTKTVLIEKNMKNLLMLPDDLPVPGDDGACNHLEGIKIPKFKVLSTNDREVDLGTEAGISVIYFYPMIGNPNSGPMAGWNDTLH